MGLAGLADKVKKLLVWANRLVRKPFPSDPDGKGPGNVKLWRHNDVLVLILALPSLATHLSAWTYRRVLQVSTWLGQQGWGWGSMVWYAGPGL